jgi:hypothetical protein
LAEAKPPFSFAEANRGEPLKTEFLLSNIYKFSLYLTGNTLRFHYKPQPVNAVWGNSRCLDRKTDKKRKEKQKQEKKRKHGEEKRN